MNEQALNGHAIVARRERHRNVLTLRRQWRRTAGEALDLLNQLDSQESAPSEHNMFIYECLFEKLKRLRQIEPKRMINQDTMVQATVIKYDCPMCLPDDNIHDANYEYEPVNN
jgi:hypothetical protein